MKINKAELIEWFWEKFNSCYLVKHDNYPQSVFMFYDPQYIRKLKLANISGEKISSKTDITGVCLFEQDWKNKNFYCNFDEIWYYLHLNYSMKFDEKQQFISDRLEEHSKLSVLTLGYDKGNSNLKLEEHSKLSVLTPCLSEWLYGCQLEEHSKLSVLTPVYNSCTLGFTLEEHSKLSVLTPSRKIR